MMPLVTTANTIIPVQAPLVNTVMPGTTVTHVPYDNVAPSVSNSQVDTNARGNSETEQIVETPLPSAIDATAMEEEYGLQDHLPNNFSVGAQATFLAQLLSQDTSTETAGMMVQYEKLVAFANVKYKPSNAMKPPPSPPGVVGRIVQTERISSRPITTPLPQAPQVTTAVAARTAPAQPVSPPTRSYKPSSNSVHTLSDGVASLPHAAITYAAIAARPEELTSALTEELA